MLGMLSSRSLIFGPQIVPGLELPLESVRFGHFAEMVSAHSSDKSYFRLGMMQGVWGSKKAETRGGGLLISFRELDGLPSISQFTCTTHNGN